jgi:hypothetical protein
MEWKLIFFTFWYTSWSFALFHEIGTFNVHLLYFPHFGTLYQEKSGKPVFGKHWIS